MVGVIVLAGIVVLIGATVQSATGIGLALLAAPLFAILDQRLLPAPIVLIGLLLQALIALRERHALDLRGLNWAVLGYLPGAGVGAGVVLVVSADALALVCAVAILVGVLISVRGWQARISRGSLLFAGATSGFIGTSTGVSGPPMALLYQHADGPRLRATIAAFFVLGNVISLFALLVAGQLGDYQLRAALWLTPWTVAGFLAGGALRGVLDGRYLRPAVLLLASAAAGLLLANTLIRP